MENILYFASASVMSTHQPSSVCPHRWTCMFNSTHCRQMMECQRGLRQTNTVMACVSFGWPMWQQYVHSNKILLLTGPCCTPTAPSCQHQNSWLGWENNKISGPVSLVFSECFPCPWQTKFSVCTNPYGRTLSHIDPWTLLHCQLFLSSVSSESNSAAVIGLKQKLN